jgi:hypothetical protein
VEADARRGDERFDFLAHHGSAQEIVADLETFNLNVSFPDPRKAPFIFWDSFPSNTQLSNLAGN